MNPNSRYLSFNVGKEHYAIPLLTVREVIGLPEITPVPFTPNYFLGIMNLRGQIISVVDLRLKLGFSASKNTSETAIIICDLGTTSLGVVVDSINAVVAPKENEVSPKPDIQSSRSTEYITGVFQRDKDLILLIDMVGILSPQDRQAMAQATARSAA